MAGRHSHPPDHFLSLVLFCLIFGFFLSCLIWQEDIFTLLINHLHNFFKLNIAIH